VHPRAASMDASQFVPAEADSRNLKFSIQYGGSLQA